HVRFPRACPARSLDRDCQRRDSIAGCLIGSAARLTIALRATTQHTTRNSTMHSTLHTITNTTTHNTARGTIFLKASFSRRNECGYISLRRTDSVERGNKMFVLCFWAAPRPSPAETKKPQAEAVIVPASALLISRGEKI